jgi:hypothetical protein
MVTGMKSEYRLRIGDANICITCPSEEFARALRDYLGYFSPETDFDIKLKLKIKKHFNDLYIPDSLFTIKKVKGNKFTIGEKLVSGYFEPVTGKGKLIVKEVLTKGLLRRVFEQVLYQAFYSVCRLKKSDSVLVHSSGVIYRGRGYLFSGPSGTGKSTIARLSRQYHVINDEICLLEFRGERIILHGTPFNGYFREKKPGSAELDTIFLISHGDSHAISPIAKPDAVKKLAREIIPPIALNEAMGPEIFPRMIDIASRVHKYVPMKGLSFTPDPRFWDEIQKITEDS